MTATSQKLFTLLVMFPVLAGSPGCASDKPLKPVVEVEEQVYTYTPANNGAGPMWCSGSTCLVRAGDRLFASGLETIPDVPPLNNCRWVLFERKPSGWEKVHSDERRTREPSPLASFDDGRLFVSVNPTLQTKPEPGSAPAKPDVVEFRDFPSAGVTLNALWEGTPAFSEHSYRSFAADSTARELILFQNIGYTHAEWTFRDPHGKWSAQGRLNWPWGADYEKPQPIRICYPNVALQGRAVYFFGVSDIAEPKRAWRDFKRQLTGQEWDYDFRRLFYTWTSDITREPFKPWMEIASREATCGWVAPGDLWLAPNDDVHLVWNERAIDERMREKFFPAAIQHYTFNHAVIRDGTIVRRTTLIESKEDKPGLLASAGRFQVTPDNRLVVCFYVSGKTSERHTISENRLIEIRPDGSASEPVTISLRRPFTSYFTATVRAGSPRSSVLEMLGQQIGLDNTISYARVRLE